MLRDLEKPSSDFAVALERVPCHADSGHWAATLDGVSEAGLPQKQKFSVPLIAWLYLAGIAALAGSYLIFPGVREFVANALQMLMNDDRTALQTWVQGFGLWGPVLILALMIAQTLISAVPMILILLVSVLAYGPVYGALLGWFGAIIAAILGYGIGLVFGQPLAERFVTPQIRDIIERNVRRYGAWAILALRLSPLVPSDGVSFVAGLVRMRFVPFALATIAGVTPIAAAVGFFGSSFERLQLGVIIVSAVSLAGLVAFILYDRFKRRAA